MLLTDEQLRATHEVELLRTVAHDGAAESEQARVEYDRRIAAAAPEVALALAYIRTVYATATTHTFVSVFTALKAASRTIAIKNAAWFGLPTEQQAED
jgi:hypothetical protein